MSAETAGPKIRFPGFDLKVAGSWVGVGAAALDFVSRTISEASILLSWAEAGSGCIPWVMRHQVLVDPLAERSLESQHRPVTFSGALI
uniref:Uncharacterized protein n=1 Tax=Mycena chlorophos TaxID=658473 RepID=A0ABQ0LJG2_MYCCL|nr:predicted protein [Mycena chlorophos]